MMKLNPASAKYDVQAKKRLAANLIRQWRDFRLNSELLLLTLPAVIHVFIFNYLTMPGIVLAFQNFKYSKGIFGSEWVGFDNFKFLFMSDTAWRITRNTVLMNALFILTGNVFSVAVALMLFEIRKKIAIKGYQTLLMFPHFLSWVVVGYMFYGLMSYRYGMANEILKSLGANPINWYDKPGYWPLILAITHIWKGGGFGSIIYFAGLMSIDKEIFEAGIIDGATKWQLTKYLSIPHLYSMLILFFILGVGRIIRADFGMFYYLTKDVPTLYSTTDVIDTYVFRALRTVGDTGMAAAAGLYQSVIGFVLVYATNIIIRKKSPENALF